MEMFITILIFVYGLLLGSFFNVVGYRIPNNISIVRPGSFCPKCRHELKWYELIPVFSYLIQGGKCRKCKCKISLFYPFIELTTGILFAISYVLFGFSLEFVIAILTASFLVIVIVSDFSYLVIPDEVTFFFSIVAVLFQLALGGWALAFSSVFYGAFLFFIMYFIMLLGSKIMKEEALGGGDVKLMFFVGTVLNVLNPINIVDFSTYIVLTNGFFHLFLSSCLALPFALISRFVKKGRVIPFGPFILLSLMIMFFVSFDFFPFFKYLIG